MNTIIINCAEYRNLIDAISSLNNDNVIKIKKIIDYNEYEKSYSSVNAPFSSFYDHIRIHDNVENLYNYKYLSTALIEYVSKYYKTAIDILQIRHVKPGLTFNVSHSSSLFTPH